MARQHGVTANTPTRFIIDAGAVYKNYGEGGQLLLGATRGGNVFKVETEQRNMEVDGAIGFVKGCKRIVNSAATITANFLEMSEALLLLANPAATATSNVITRSDDIATSDYATNIAIVGNSTYSPTGYIVVKLLNALADGNIELAFNPKDESLLSIVFVAHFDPTTLSDEPWSITNPVVG